MGKWYQEGAVYQIYPRSFKDGNGDGIGDLIGIIEKLDYIKSLGVKTIWLSPVYKSPLFDFGYDISDYYDIHEDYGTLDDFKKLIDEVHKRDMKLIMDLVVNHTSNEHYWFKEACKSKDNKYHDFYLWKDKPNNWTSLFGGKAWTYNERTNEYYLHLFAKEQPDLNWENPEVRNEVKKILRYWLDLGVDGFRCDVINLISKTPGLPNGKPKIALVGSEHYLNGPNVHKYLQEIKEEVFVHYDSFTVGECIFLKPEIALTYIENEKELNMVFQFDHMAADNFLKWFIRKFSTVRLKKALTKWQYKINGRGWNTLYFENHDQPRSVTRFGNENYHYESATMLATYLYFQQGTPFIYQGQEIGMTNAHFTKLEQYKDIETFNIYKIGRKFFSHKNMMRRIKKMSRDNARTPMQWDNSDFAGFSNKEPWIEVNPNHKEINVERDLEKSNSIIKYYRKILGLRKEYQTIIYGSYKEYYPNKKNYICYERVGENDKFLIICNFSEKTKKLKAPFNLEGFKLLLTNYNNEDNLLKPYEARVYYKEG
ncbi:MAG TPA: alpha-glucosidase [Acholeplasmataceae bacterium]|nr:alpha-glucosidase [Acholeplasmataceae bacterium]